MEPNHRHALNPPQTQTDFDILRISIKPIQ